MASGAAESGNLSPEARRVLAVELIHEGLPVSAVASRLAVSRQSVRAWIRIERSSGTESLLRHTLRGRRPRLSLEAIANSVAEAALRFPNRPWTLAEFASHIEGTFGVRYHPSHVWRIMAALGIPIRPRKANHAERETH